MPDIDPAPFVAEVPEEAYNQFLYGTDHVTHGGAITSLQAVRIQSWRTAPIHGPWSR